MKLIVDSYYLSLIKYELINKSLQINYNVYKSIYKQSSRKRYSCTF